MLPVTSTALFAVDLLNPISTSPFIQSSRFHAIFLSCAACACAANQSRQRLGKGEVLKRSRGEVRVRGTERESENEHEKACEEMKRCRAEQVTGRKELRG